MEKQTAVSWLVNEHFGGIDNCTPDFRNKIEQSNEMFEQQIKDAWNNGFREFYDGSSTPEEYYKETYETK
jgi:hypothetical protein